VKALKWHRVGTKAPYDYVASGETRNFLAALYPYGWELFCLNHGEKHPQRVSVGPWHRLKDAKAHAQRMEQARECSV
jgi:hypothetical protein